MAAANSLEENLSPYNAVAFDKNECAVSTNQESEVGNLNHVFILNRNLNKTWASINASLLIVTIRDHLLIIQ